MQEQALHSFCDRPFRKFPSSANLTRRRKNCLLKSHNVPFLLFPPLPFYIITIYAILNPYFTVIHNRTNVEIVLYRTTLTLCGYRGPLWPTLK